MLMVISPAKTMDFSPSPVARFTTPRHMDQTWQLVGRMRGMSSDDIKSLMGVSDKIAELNRQRYADFDAATTLDSTTKQALLAFKGDTYKDMELEAWTDEDFAFAQQRLRILSGLYGQLRPLDIIKAYRLEMGTSLATEAGKNLYAFWGTRIAQTLTSELQQMGSDTIVHLASEEYFKSIARHLGSTRVIQPAFLDFKNGTFKTISFFAKRARGAMAAWAIRRRVTDPEALQDFNTGGYRYVAEDSSPERPVFQRKAS